jgi:hypothetical protein
MPSNGAAHQKSLGRAQEPEDDNTRSQRNEHRRHAKEQQCTHRHRLATDPITERAGQDACDRHPAQRRVDRDADLRRAGVKRDREWRCDRLRFKQIHEYEKTRQRHEKLDPCGELRFGCRTLDTASPPNPFPSVSAVVSVNPRLTLPADAAGSICILRSFWT